MKRGLGLILFLLVFKGISQPLHTNKTQFIDYLLLAAAEDHAFPGFVISYSSTDTSWSKGYGFRRWGSDEQITASTRFQLGSVGKILTAIAVLQQVERGALSLDKDIKEYLPWIDTQSSVTLKDLLTHSAGMNDRNIGYFARDSNNLESLHEHIASKLPTFHQKAGLEINYSNFSYALAGYLVQVVSSTPFQAYVQRHIFDPLEMEESLVGFDFSYQSKLNYAEGHKVEQDGFEVTKEYARSALPAGSFISTANDMQKLIRAMSQRNSTLINKTSWELMFTRQFSNHELLTGYSLGLEEQVVGNQTYWAKGGMLTGFLSQVIFLPDEAALFLAMNVGNDEFLEDFHRLLRNEFYAPHAADSEGPEVPDLSMYTGEYRNGRYDRDGIENIISLFRGAFDVWEADGGLQVYHNGAIHTYQYVGENVFENQTNPTEKLVFKFDDHGKVNRLYRSVNIGGLTVPATFEKTQWYNSPSFINEYYGVIPLIIVAYSICLILVLAIRLIRLIKPNFWKWKLLPRRYYLIALVGIVSLIVHIVKAIMPLVKSPLSFMFGLPDEFLIFNSFSYVILVIAIVMLIHVVLAFSRGYGSVLSRILFGLTSVCLSIHALFLIYWNFI